MPSVECSEDVASWLTYMLTIFNKLPIELQLVWLYEILVKTTLIHRKVKFEQNKDSYVISTQALHELVAESDNELYALQRLSLFRNRYVHCSYYGIEKLWRNCIETQTVLDAIAQRYGVTLNWSKTVALDVM